MMVTEVFPFTARVLFILPHSGEMLY